MITEFQLSPNDNKNPMNVKWDETAEDYVIDGRFTRSELIDAVETIKRITEWQD